MAPAPVPLAKVAVSLTAVPGGSVNTGPTVVPADKTVEMAVGTGCAAAGEADKAQAARAHQRSHGQGSIYT